MSSSLPLRRRPVKSLLVVRYPSGHLESAFLLRFSLELAYGLYGGLRARERAEVCTCLLGTFHSEEEDLDILCPLSNNPNFFLVFIVKLRIKDKDS